MNSSSTEYGILKLSIRAFQGIEEIVLEPTGNLVFVHGGNGSGKTSLLEALVALFGGKTFIPQVPVRIGEDKAVIHAEILGYTIASEILPDRTERLSVRTADGLKLANPRQFLSDLVKGSLAFDPAAFMAASAKDRAAMLVAALCPDPARLAAAQAEKKATYDARRDRNAEVKMYLGQAEGMSVPPGVGLTLVDTSDLRAKAEDQRREHERYAALKRSYEDAMQKEARANDTVHALEEQLRAAVAAVDRAKQTSYDAFTALKAAPTPPSIDYAAEIEAAGKENAAYQRRQDKAKVLAKAEAARKAAEELDAKYKALEGEIKKLVDIDRLSVPGAVYDGTDITVDGVPFDQLCESKRLLIGISVAMLHDPKLRIVLIRNGNALDEASIGVLREMAVRHRFQAFVETIHEQSSGEFRIVMANGRAQ